MSAPVMDTSAIADPAVFRRILGHFCTGIVVITGYDDAGPVGMTCQTFSSLSLNPPLVMFSPARTSTTWPRLRDTGTFAVNILSAGQQVLSRAFAVTGADKFAGVDWYRGHTGSPIIEGSMAHIECELAAIYPGGDHDIVIGRPLAAGEDPSLSPLLFFRSGYGTYEPA
ncbi:flavin reductase family protein [Dactylosporangium fulvum]|uniref:Flavin reductase family protein n=1 Tax=Dactylosporangium fulvum TaxID=53359 RepID=A0ABY5VS19_9ACTN|nr:flavin reductase family protein [Dactylosporangium fulvum]UWP80085.1 flavin reductase family protein [Dactylosporangium fulvum]